MEMKISLIFMLFGILVFLFWGVMHESVHQRIFEEYGIESKVKYGIISFSTIPECEGNCGLSNEEITEMNRLHIQNEIVGYNLQGIFSVILTGLALIILLLESAIPLD